MLINKSSKVDLDGIIDDSEQEDEDYPDNNV
jgi:hypothetical protein